MAVCNICKQSMSGPGQACALCLAKMINYAEGEYHDTDDPAVKRFNEELAKQSGPRAPQQSGGCAVVALAALAIPAALAVLGAVHLIT
ncbi:hypothetical protein [Glycomyces paridis]|uniref:Uncharacterized protein n=1 Tax=Glycomyces paridis TaxID=2126555 RepID=A0A4S8P2V7_9ACTN|nr:hypothetical protein [Glycomyces paridis]THV24358.1 hypothetical protein E9998_21265 [Glycomyces paridis]